MMVAAFLDVKPETFGRRAPVIQTIALNLLVTVVYAATGYAGLRLAFISDVVTLFWPPAGIAFATLWLGGFKLLPGVVAGAFLINLSAFGNPWLAALVAVGNALPGITATSTLRRMIARRGDPGELWRVVWFILIAALLSTTVSASIGTLAVAASGQGRGAAIATWPVWWMGDAMGVVIVAPPILLWRRLLKRPRTWHQAFDAVGMTLAGSGVVAGLLLIHEPLWAVELCKLFTLLVSLWAAARYGLHGPAAMTLFLSAGTVLITAAGAGPFVRPNFYDTFAVVHSYLFAVAITGMLLASALADLQRTIASERLARAEAEAFAARRIQLLNMISHDVRTPLSGMTGVLQTLARMALSPHQTRLVGLGLRAGATLTTLIADILDVARADAGRIKLTSVPFDPRQSLVDIVDTYRDRAATKELQLELMGDGDLPEVVIGDRARFEQVLGNLVGNAVSYTSVGSVDVKAAWRVDAPLPLIIDIVDTGPGIDPRHAAQMFDAFAAPEWTPRSSGLGFGLHITNHLVGSMGGAITYTARSGGGSQFRVALPLLRGAVRCSPAIAADPRLCVVLVEDDEITREATTALLMTLGHDVTAVADGADVLSKILPGVDLVLLDLQLAGSREEGIAVARRIRRIAGAGPGVTILALTADAAPGRRDACIAAGIDGLIIKPIDLSAGLAAVVAAARFVTPVAEPASPDLQS